MYIVVAGASELAVRTVEALQVDHHVTLVTTDPTGIARLENLDIQTVVGRPTSLLVLREARVDQADYFIAASDSDETNIVSCIAADQLKAKRRICILHGRSDDHVGETDEDVTLASSVDVDAVIRPSHGLSDEILRIVKVDGALDVRSFFRGAVGLFKALVEEGSAISKDYLGKLPVKNGVRFVMVQRGDTFFVPTDATQLEAGDRVTMTGRNKLLVRTARRQFRGPRAVTTKRRAIIAGGGSVGVRVAQGLVDCGWSVKLIERDLERCKMLSETLDCLVLHGDGSDMELLQEEFAGMTSALIAVTNNDEKNLLISLIAKQLGVDRIITRADRLSNEKVFEKVGIDVVLSARGAAVRSIVSDIVNADHEHLAELDHGEISVLELELPPSYATTAFKDIQLPTVAAIGAVRRGRKVIIPNHKSDLRADDHVLLISRTRDEDQSKAYILERGIPRS